MVDDPTFERVYAKHGAAVLRYCAYSLGRSCVAEDIAAETFATYLQKGEHVPEERAEAWLIRVARNLCASHHRGQKRFVPLPATDPAVADAWNETGEWVYVARLKEAERLVVYLRVVEERGFADVARLLGKSESAVKMTYYRAVERIRREMRQDGLGPEVSLAGGADHA